MAFLKVLDSRGNRIPAKAVYEGASTTRRMGTYGLYTSGPNTSLYSSLNSLRSRSRHFLSNNPLAKGGVDSFVANLIGTGITPRWQVEDAGLKKEIQELWADSVLELDADGVSDFYGLQALAAAALITSGEVFIRLKPQRAGSRMLVPLKIQILEADLLDESFESVAEGGNEIRMGIEFNKDGERVAYHFFKEHPGEYFLNGDNTTRIRIPADQILHVFRPLRPGQQRGTPWMAPIITKLYEIDQADDAKLVRRKVQNLFGGFITRPPGEEAPNFFGDPDGQTDDGTDIMALEPGLFPELPPGCDVHFSSPPAGDDSMDWDKGQRRDVARGLGVTYEQMTGDLADVNFSSIRAGLVEFRRFCSMVQNNTLIHQFCRPVGKAWLEAAVLSGALDIPDFYDNRRQYYRVQWHPQPFAYVEPSKDVKTDLIRVRAGFASRAEIAAERGRDIESIDAEIREDNARSDEYGLIHDTDPRRVSLSGVYQETEEKNEQ